MDAGIFARQLTEALDGLTAGISIEPEDIDGIAGARVLSYTTPTTSPRTPGSRITAPDGSRVQVTILQRALPHNMTPATPATSRKENTPWIPRS